MDRIFFLGVFVITATLASAASSELTMADLADKARAGDNVAFHKLQFAANHGIDPAQLEMGILYAVGGGPVSQSDTTALYWFRKAADHFEDDTAQYNLAMAYENGHGTPTNHIVSYALFKLSMSAQFPPEIADEQIKKFSAKMTVSQIEAGDVLVIRMMNRKIGVIKAIDQNLGGNR